MKELLVPVGSMEALSIAIHSGADAVYLGGKKFGARAFASNFDDEEMLKAIKLCHLYGVKIYVTVNTLVYESELNEVLNYLEFLYTNGVDAVIIQDIGLIYAARKKFPNLEIHASTQVHNTNEEGLNILSDLGVKRVVLARELSLKEINFINTPLEKEVFIHGALCISYSGECLFSSLLMDRSGNRGSCAQICRLPFKLMEDMNELNCDGEYLLSTKELNTSSYFKEIMESDVISLKIEGRMKSPEYVGCVTRLYRDLMDKYYQGKNVSVDENILNDLRVIFNRDYTKGFLFNATNQDLMNIKTQNHLGIYLGKIIKTTNKYVYIKLDHNLNQGDGIRFNDVNEGMIVNYIYNEKEELINQGKNGNIILLDNKFNISSHSTINKTLDTLVLNKYRNPENKKIPIDIEFKAHIDGLTLIFDDGINKVCLSSKRVELAKKNPITKKRVEEQLIKLGNTPFKHKNILIEMDDNLFINIKDLNELRREATLELIRTRENVKKDIVINKINEEKVNKYSKDINISILCRNDEQIKASLELGINRIYLEDKKLYSKYMNNHIFYYRTNRVSDEVKYPNILATELGALKKHKNCIGDYYLNVTNHYTINHLMNYASLLTLSVEMKDKELEYLMNYYNNRLNVEKIVFSNIELMITKYCPLNMLVNKDKVCLVCKNNKKYYLKDRNNKFYRILSDDKHITHIMHYKELNLIDKVSYYQKLGINNFRIELLDQTYDETKKIINSLLNEL